MVKFTNSNRLINIITIQMNSIAIKLLNSVRERE